MKGYKRRKVRLIGQLAGPIWQPGFDDCRQDVDVDLSDMAKRFVNQNGSGLIDAIESVVDHAGDFQFAKLTSDSFVVIEHTYTRAGREVANRRFVDVTRLPSLADRVDLDKVTQVYD